MGNTIGQTGSVTTVPQYEVAQQHDSAGPTAIGQMAPPSATDRTRVNVNGGGTCELRHTRGDDGSQYVRPEDWRRFSRCLDRGGRAPVNVTPPNNGRAGVRPRS